MARKILILMVIGILFYAGCKKKDKQQTGGLSARQTDKTVLYVATDGNDNSPGTKGKPFATIDRAKARVRELKNEVDTPITVLVRGGTYHLSKPLVFTPEDSGTQQQPITYAAYRGEEPVFSGGIPITGWQKGDGPVWTTVVPKVQQGDWYFRQLFVDGRRCTPARIPNNDYLRTAGPGKESDKLDPETKISFYYQNDDLKWWPNMDDVVLMAYHSWTTSLHRIKSIDADNKLVHFINPCNWSFSYFEKQQRYHVEFVAEGLDSPGEWYLDRSTGILSYYPRDGEDMTAAKVIAPLPEELLKLQGETEAERFVEYLNFQRLSFEYTDWTMPLTGKVDNQAAHDLKTSAIHAHGAKHCQFKQCRVAHTGGFGIWLSLGCQDNRIEQCNIYDLGAGGVRIGPAETVTWLDRRVRKSEPPYEQDIPVPLSLRTDRNEVFNCFIHDGGNIYMAAVGIMVGRGSYNRIAHNDVCDFYYSGISIGWCWEYIPSYAHHNLIEYNHVHHLGWGHLADMGGIYAPGVSHGTVIRNNRIHDLIPDHIFHASGIYLDDCSSDIVVENNVVYNTVGGFRQHFGNNNVVRNNIIAFSQNSGQKSSGQIHFSRPEPHRAFNLERNIFYYNNESLFTGKWGQVDAYKLDYNVYWDASGSAPEFPDQRSLEQWQKTGNDLHSIIADPRFVDPDNYDFRLKPNSPALKLGFKPIDTSKMGLVGPSEWTQLPEKVKRPQMPAYGEFLWR